MSGFGFYYAVNNDTSLTFTDERKRNLWIELEPEFAPTNETFVARHKEHVLDGDKVLKKMHPYWYIDGKFSDVPIRLNDLNRAQRASFQKVVYTLLADSASHIKSYEITDDQIHHECLIVIDDGNKIQNHVFFIDKNGVIYGGELL